MKQSKTKRQINSLVREIEQRQEHPRQMRTHFATVYEGHHGFYGACFVAGCLRHSEETSGEEAVAWCVEHNDLPPLELGPDAQPETDWYGGRALQPWEQGYDDTTKLAILFGPGSV